MRTVNREFMSRKIAFSLTVILMVSLSGCLGFDRDNGWNDLLLENSSTANQAGQSEQTVVLLGPLDRQAELSIPGDIGENETLPLVVVLHGFSRNPDYVYSFFQGVNSVDDNRHLLLTPNGTENSRGSYFWNATPACCDNYNQNIDDVSYLSSLISTAITDYGADQNRVMLIGHSNGGFMSHRMACDAGNILHTIINFAGATYGDFNDCNLTGYPNIVNVHGTDDGVIDYNGGDLSGEPYASSPDGAAYWANRSGCDSTSTQMGTMDLVSGDGNNETTLLQHLDCEQGNRVTHWRLSGIGHVPSFTNGSLINAAFDWAFNHSVDIDGCTDTNATNYDENATVDDGSCEYPPPPVPGCMDSNATNYDEDATMNDDSCAYLPPPEPPIDDDDTPIDDDDNEDSGDIESETPEKSGFLGNISMMNIVLVFALGLLLSLLTLFKIGYNRR